MFWHGEKYLDIKSLCLVEYANYLHDKKNYAEAIKYYEEALSYSVNYYAYSGLAAVFVEKRLFNEALTYCNKAISIKRPDVLMNFLLIVIYESLGQNGLVKETFQKTLKFFDDNFAAAYNQLSYTYLQFGMYKEAEFYCGEAIKINPTEAGLHNNLAKIYLFQKKVEEAREEFQKVVELTADKRYKKYALEEISKIDTLRGNKVRGSGLES